MSQVYHYVDEYRNLQNRSLFFTNWNRQLSLYLKCSICENVYLEPIQTECGCRFCFNCIDNHINIENMFCPNCQIQISRNNFIKDKAIEKEIFNLEIKCFNENCDEIYVFKELDNHYENCEYRKEQCDRCQQLYIYQFKQQHITELCSKILMTCNDCGLEMMKEDYEMKHRNIEMEIDNLCEKWIGTCPYKCNDEIYSNIKYHLIKCINKQINCPLNNFGCNFISPEKDMNEHLKIDSFQHQILMINEINRLQTDNNHIKQVFQETNESLIQEMKLLKEFNNDLLKIVGNIQKIQIENKSNIDNIKSEINIYKQSISDSSINNENEINFINGEIIWNIGNIRQKINDAKCGIETQIISDGFYINRPGYKFRLKIYPNGDGCGKDNYLSIYFMVMKGEYDNELSWPFKEKVSLSIVSSNISTPNVNMKMKPDNNSACYNKPINDLNLGAGQPQFIKLSEILNKSDYLHESSLKIRMKIN